RLRAGALRASRADRPRRRRAPSPPGERDEGGPREDGPHRAQPDRARAPGRAPHHCRQRAPPAMKSLTRYLTLHTRERMAFVNITADVEKVVDEAGIREGLCLVNAMHITASVFINDDEPGLHEDYKRWLEQLAPFDPSPQRYHHNRTGEDNGDAHHKR